MTQPNEVRSYRWKRGIQEYGRLKWYTGILTIPLWLPLYVGLKWLAKGMQTIGSLGEKLDRLI